MIGNAIQNCREVGWKKRGDLFSASGEECVVAVGIFEFHVCASNEEFDSFHETSENFFALFGSAKQNTSSVEAP
jgi:hypothetical protein